MEKARGSLVKAERLLVVLVALFFCMLPAASALVVGINIDIHNNTGLDAHDFHVEGRIESCCEPTLLRQFGWVNTPSDTFPNFNITIADAGGGWWEFKAEWSSRNVNPSDVGHFGLFFDVCGRNVIVDLDAWWTDQGGNRIDDPNGNGWPIPGFEVPAGSDASLSQQVFRLLGDAGEEGIDTTVQEMELAVVDPPANIGEELLSLLNVDEVGLIDADWFPATELDPDIALPVELPAGSGVVEVPLEGLMQRVGAMVPGQLLLVQTRVSWPAEQAGRWIFDVHEVPPPDDPCAVNPQEALAVTWGGLKGRDR